MPGNEEDIPSQEIILGYLSQLTGFSLNVKPSYLVITKDKLYIHLDKTIKNQRLRLSWTTPLSIFISLLLAILNANFKDTIFPASVWKAIFIIGVVVAFIWLMIAIVRCFKRETIEQIIERMKNDPV